MIKSESVISVEDAIRYKFRNKNMLQAATAYTSYDEYLNYKRFEFIGDAILDIIIMTVIKKFANYKFKNECEV